MLMQTITQDFAQHAMDEIATMKVEAEGAKLEFAGAVLNDKTGEQMEYQYLIKNPSKNEHGVIHIETNLAV